MEMEERSLPVAAEVPVCGRAIAHFANPFRQTSTGGPTTAVEPKEVFHSIYDLLARFPLTVFVTRVDSARFSFLDLDHLRIQASWELIKESLEGPTVPKFETNPRPIPTG